MKFSAIWGMLSDLWLAITIGFRPTLLAVFKDLASPFSLRPSPSAHRSTLGLVAWRTSDRAPGATSRGAATVAAYVPDWERDGGRGVCAVVCNFNFFAAQGCRRDARGVVG